MDKQESIFAQIQRTERQLMVFQGEYDPDRAIQLSIAPRQSNSTGLEVIKRIVADVFWILRNKPSLLDDIDSHPYDPNPDRWTEEVVDDF